MGWFEDAIANAKARLEENNAQSSGSNTLSLSSAEPTRPANDINIPAFNPRTPIVDRVIVGPGGVIDVHDDPVFTYIGGDGQRYWDSYAPETQDRLISQMVDAGLVGKGTTASDRYTSGAAWEYVLGAANDWEVTPFTALAMLQDESRRSGRGGGGGGSRGPVIEIPDYPVSSQDYQSPMSNVGKGKHLILC